MMLKGATEIEKMYNKTVAHIQFLFHSKNQHGIHSPFVYDFITKCLYKSISDIKRLSEVEASVSKQTLKVIEKCIPYFQVESIKIIGNDALQTAISVHYPNLKTDTKSADFLYLSEPSLFKIKKLLGKGVIHNNSCILIDNIYSSKENLQKWHTLIVLKKFHVSINLFYCGLLFVRKQQVKEDFRIRI